MNHFTSEFFPGEIILQAPHYLWAILFVPLLWWLLRLIPPEAIRRRFPSLRLLQKLPPLRAQTAYTPIWLLILRGAMVILLLIGFAEPVWIAGENDAPPPDQPIVMLMDNCWSAAPNFAAMKTKALSILENLPPQQNIAVIAACPPGANPVISNGLIPTPAAKALIRHLKQRDEIANWSHTMDALRSLELAPIAQVNVISSGIMNSTDDRDRVVKELVAYDDASIALPPAAQLPVKISGELVGGQIKVRLQRFSDADEAQYTVIARNSAEHIMNVMSIILSPGYRAQNITLPIPPEAIGEVANIAVPNMGMLAMLPWQAPAVPARIGLVAHQSKNALTDPNHYLQSALSSQTSVLTDHWQVLLGQNLPVIITTDSSLPNAELSDIVNWLQDGGTLIRFTGNKLAQRNDDLWPAKPIALLRHSPEQFLSNDAIGIGTIPMGSPLQDLQFRVAPKFYQHTLLAAPDRDTKIWASYSDGTPMILEKIIGKGRSILITTPPLPNSGNWVLTDAFPKILTRIVSAQQTVADPRPDIDLQNMVILRENNLPQDLDVTDLNNHNTQTALAPYVFMLVLLLWLSDQALIMVRFAGLLWLRR